MLKLKKNPRQGTFLSKKGSEIMQKTSSVKIQIKNIEFGSY